MWKATQMSLTGDAEGNGIDISRAHCGQPNSTFISCRANFAAQWNGGNRAACVPTVNCQPGSNQLSQYELQDECESYC
jgi:hypothetical protein